MTPRRTQPKAMHRKLFRSAAIAAGSGSALWLAAEDTHGAIVTGWAVHSAQFAHVPWQMLTVGTLAAIAGVLCGYLFFRRKKAASLRRDGTDAAGTYLTAIAERDRAQRYLDIAGVIMVALDVEGCVTLLNKKGCEILECTESEALGVNWFDTFISPRNQKEIHQAFTHLIKEAAEFPEYYENVVLTKTGQERLIAWHNTLLRDAAGNIVATLSSGLDITEQKKTEQSLRFTQFATDRATEATFWVAPDGRFIYVNEAACHNLGYSRQELLNMTVFDIDPVFQPEQWPRHCHQIKEEGVVRLESFHKAKDGRMFPVAITVNFLVYEGREYHCANVRDISERKAAEGVQQQLMRQLQSKNEELQSIVFIASHDLRSPLVNIRGFTGELEKSLTQLRALLANEPLNESTKKQLDVLLNNDIPESLGFINAGNRKMDTLLTGLLRLSRIGTAQLCPITLDMNQMFEGVINNFRFRMRNADIDIAVDKPLPACRGDAVLINQVFTNLTGNAIKYRHPEPSGSYSCRCRGEGSDRCLLCCG